MRGIDDATIVNGDGLLRDARGYWRGIGGLYAEVLYKQVK